MPAVGIDVRKAALDVAIDGLPGVVCYANTPAGLRKLVERLEEVVDARIVVEATGGYEMEPEPPACSPPTISTASLCLNVTAGRGL